jgi:protein MpaA
MSDANGLLEVPRPERGLLGHPARPYGRSVRGHDLEYFGPQKGPVDLLILASIHGDEVETTVVLSEALRRVRRGDLSNPVILAANPDGVMRGTRCNANGVDLNRNWPSQNWSSEPVFHKAHGESVRDIRLSPGSAPASEPETRALRQLVERLQPRALISMHAPLACIDAPSSSPLAQWIARQVDLPLVADVGYATPGSFGSWCAEQGLDIITWELPPEPITRLLTSHAPVLFRLITGRFDPVGS